MTDVTLRIVFEDEEFLDSSLKEYAQAVERGEMSEEEALDSGIALAMGMAHFDVS